MTTQASIGTILEPDEYELLPEGIKMIYTRKEWLWLGEERDRVLQRETEPDWDVYE